MVDFILICSHVLPKFKNPIANEVSLRWLLTHFMPLASFYTPPPPPENRKPEILYIFSGRMESDQ